MTIETFINELEKLNIKITDNQLNHLQTYCSFLLEYNLHTNLTAIRTEPEVYLKHFYDSLTITKAIDLNKITNVLDIGTGAGFPGMILKIIYPHLSITLLDSNNKKTEFLKELASKLSIEVNIINDRAEKYIINKREYFDLVVSRAVANLQVLTELSLPFVKINGLFIAMKANADEELTKSENCIKICGGELINKLSFQLPIENAERSLIVIKKITKTNIEYPRLYDKIIKKPL